MLIMALPVNAEPLRVSVAAVSRDAKGLWSRSIGFPWRGRLSGGVYLDEDKHVRHVQKYEGNDRFWGSAELVSLVSRVARVVSRVHGPGRLSAGELSARRGGRVLGHRSHQSGRDMDIGFYLDNDLGKTLAWPEFVYLRRDGTRPIDGGATLARFDDARNWTLVEALATETQVPVQYMFVANGIRRRVLRYGEAHGASEELLGRVARLMMPPGSGRPHTDHFHIRIYCPVDDRPSCREQGPVWPWVAGE